MENKITQYKNKMKEIRDCKGITWGSGCKARVTDGHLYFYNYSKSCSKLDSNMNCTIASKKCNEISECKDLYFLSDDTFEKLYKRFRFSTLNENNNTRKLRSVLLRLPGREPK